MAEKNNTSLWRLMILVFIFLAGIALARAEIALKSSNDVKYDVATLKANYTNIKELLNKLDNKMDIVLGVRK